jgi:hypothetical protein
MHTHSSTRVCFSCAKTKLRGERQGLRCWAPLRFCHTEGSSKCACNVTTRSLMQAITYVTVT